MSFGNTVPEAIPYLSKDLLASYEVSGQITAIEDLIAQGADMEVVLRLLCLASITAGGIKGKTLENLKREILQVRASPQRSHHTLIME